MKVQTAAIDDFLTNLGSVKPEHVFNKLIYFSVNRSPVDNADKRKATRFSVIVQASAVIDVVESGSQYLLDYAENVGFDRIVGSRLEGSNKAGEIKDQLVVFCRERGIEVMPGVVSE
jgi:hypothetical protein